MALDIATTNFPNGLATPTLNGIDTSSNPIAIAVTGGSGAAGTSTTAGGAGMAASISGGAGGAKTDTGAAAGGAGGATTVGAGVGGATASAGTDAGGAGGSVAVTAAAGGAASAGTGNGGAGGSVVVTTGAGGASTGGTAGVAGMMFVRGNQSRTQGAPTAQTVSATLTAAALLSGIITGNQGAGAGASYQLPLGTSLEAALPTTVAVNDSIDFFIINTSTVAAEDITVTTNTDWTLVGSMVVESRDSDRANSSGHFRARRTAAHVFTLYRLA